MIEVKEIDTSENTTSVTPKDSTLIRSFSLSCNDITVELSNVGASITKILMPRNPKRGTEEKVEDDQLIDDIVLGYPSPLEMYQTRNPVYLAVTVGRVANRIAKGKFVVDGVDYTLDTNIGPNHLHGGFDGFSHRIWEAEILSCPDLPGGKAVQFTLISPDGDQGYPGTVKVTATYSLVEKGDLNEVCRGVVLNIDLKGDLLDDGNLKTTPINMVQHTYFNLAGHGYKDGILDHSLTLPNCHSYTPVDETSIPTGEVRSLDQDPIMDWRLPGGRILRDALREYGVHRAGRSEDDVSRDLEHHPHDPYGFDHNYVVTHPTTDDTPMTKKSTVVGILEHAATGRRLTVCSDAPGVQLYTANWLDRTSPMSSKDGKTAPYGPWQGLCLETQAFPNSIGNQTSDSDDAFSQGRCFLLKPLGPSYQHHIEYHLENI